MFSLSEPPEIFSWEDINQVLDSFHCHEAGAGDSPKTIVQGKCPFPRPGGIAFVTYNYGIDGVTIEIAKYARALATLLGDHPTPVPIHYIGGNFFKAADAYIPRQAPRLHISHFDGWDKWHGGRWFRRLFFSPMPAGSAVSDQMAVEIWNQGLASARMLSHYFLENKIDTVIPVNINSNPGNPASALAVVLATETTRARVLNSTHDFFWEGGKPACLRPPGVPPGSRDHFFTNRDNPQFYKFFQRILPWAGSNWCHLTINSRQSHTLIQRYGFARSRVILMGTTIPPAFFTPCSFREKRYHRLRMAHILSPGHGIIHATPVNTFLEQTDAWMANQQPVVCGDARAVPLDMTAPDALYLLQPTRVLTKKRIYRNWDLLEQLFLHTALGKTFAENPRRTLTLHITGPVPVEHKADLEQILTTFDRVLETLPRFMARRIFTAFSVGNETHEGFETQNFARLEMAEIYKMADMVFLPSETEGRGLPILEGGAAGIPVVCSRYTPAETFNEVVGTHLAANMRIRYILFPENEFSRSMLDETTSRLLAPDRYCDEKRHNRRAVAARFHPDALMCKFHDALSHLC